MKRKLRSIKKLLIMFRKHPRKTIDYLHDLKTLKSQMPSAMSEFPLGRLNPQIGDKFSDSGVAKGHYFHQDLLVARKIYLNKPTIHVDVGSSIGGFVAHVASFRSINVIDIRPLPYSIPNIRFIQADFMIPVKPDLVEYCDSLSCLHAMEHFGLGRYGDPVKYDGHLLGLNNLHRMLKKGGKLYFSVPIGPQRIEFNAHRVFSLSYLLEYFDGKYHVDYFSFVDDQGDLHENATLTENDVQNNFGCVEGCGVFEMTKL